MTDKIKISKISKKCYSQKGFDDRGCYGSSCGDSCCKYGADFDKAAYDLVMRHREAIEPLIDKNIEECFHPRFESDSEYLGGRAVRSLKDNSGFCVFHSKTGKGCVLYSLVNSGDVSKRIIPSICRLFPLSWGDGELVVCDRGDMPDDCNCNELQNNTARILLETQKHEIEDIFDVDEKERRRILSQIGIPRISA